MEEKNIKILAIESSCDETAAAVVENGRKVLSNVISTQIDIHTLYGGVVPEIASRKHLERINQVVKEALKQASVTLEDIDAVAVTYGPVLLEHFLLERQRQRRLHMQQESRLLVFIILRVILQPITLKTRI